MRYINAIRVTLSLSVSTDAHEEDQSTDRWCWCDFFQCGECSAIKTFSQSWSNITSFSFPVVFSSLPPLCAVPVVAASSVANIHTIIQSEITLSLATAAVWCGRKRSSPSPFRFTSIRCTTRPSTGGNTWIRSAFYPSGTLWNRWPIFY